MESHARGWTLSLPEELKRLGAPSRLVGAPPFAEVYQAELRRLEAVAASLDTGPDAATPDAAHPGGAGTQEPLGRCGADLHWSYCSHGLTLQAPGLWEEFIRGHFLPLAWPELEEASDHELWSAVMPELPGLRVTVDTYVRQRWLVGERSQQAAEVLAYRLSRGGSFSEVIPTNSLESLYLFCRSRLKHRLPTSREA